MRDGSFAKMTAFTRYEMVNAFILCGIANVCQL